MYKFANWIKDTQALALQRSVNLSQKSNFISFALGLPAAEFFPEDLFKTTIAQLLQNSDALQYQPPSELLKKQIVDLMKNRGVDCEEGEIFLTSGAQQGISLLARLLLNTGDQILTEEFIYPGFTQIVKPYQPQFLTVDTDLKNGINVESIEKYLREGNKPAFIYVIPDGHNPLGVNISTDKRKALVKLVEKYGIPIIEDDPYGFLNFSQVKMPPLKAYNNELIFYVGSFSKILAPSLRVGWLIVPKTIIPKLAIIKDGDDLNVSSLSQRIIEEFIRNNFLYKHINLLKEEYKKKRDIMLNSIQQFLPNDVTHSVPNNGFFIWLNLMKNIDTAHLLETAINKFSIGYIPGSIFYAGKIANSLAGKNCIRLNFTYPNEKQIVEGIKSFLNLFELYKS